MLQLHTIKPNPGAKHRRKRLGNGESSGLGKTCGKGNKGQKARSGGSIRPGFEGGQMPLHRRLPKKGAGNIIISSMSCAKSREIPSCCVRETELIFMPR